MKVGSEVLQTNEIGLHDIGERINEHRELLNRLIIDVDLKSINALEVSRRLDELINEYYRAKGEM